MERGVRSFGRILRDESDRVVRIQEAKEEGCDLSRTEVNPGLFCIQTAWLARVLPTLGSNNAQGEYYLTDLVERARAEGAQLATVSIPAEEVFGINTPVDLETAQTILIRREGRPGRVKVPEIVD